jgi:hypothetical protein
VRKRDSYIGNQLRSRYFPSSRSGGLDPVDTNRCVFPLPPVGVLVVWIQQWHEEHPFSTNPFTLHIRAPYSCISGGAVFVASSNMCSGIGFMSRLP